MHGLDDSVTVLEHYAEDLKDALMPSIKSIGSIKDLTDNVSHDWSQGVQISYREMACQVKIVITYLFLLHVQYTLKISQSVISVCRSGDHDPANGVEYKLFIVNTTYDICRYTTFI